MRIALLALASLVLSFASLAQSGFEGMVEYRFEYLDVPDRLSRHVESLSSGMTVMMKDGKCRKQQNGQAGGERVIVDDYDQDKRFILMNVFGRRIALMVDTIPESESTQGEPLEYKYKRESREIAGYECKRVEMHVPGEEHPTDLWVTDTFQCRDPNFRGLNGFPLEFILIQNGIEVRATAERVEEMKLGDPLFDVPPGYEQMNSEQFKTFLATLEP